MSIERIEVLQQQVNALQIQHRILQEELNKVKVEIGVQSNEIKNLESKIEDLRMDIEERLKHLEKSIEQQFKAEIHPLNERLNETKSIIWGIGLTVLGSLIAIIIQGALSNG